ncbi:hypothetical protein PoB_001918900 [Plakobranchus ocellatus]|uniref:Craniofacial development protein 2-like n=1 Tax=Plakobranchus ocellatus TaxID=259542 RepID=A0AAV3ZBG5_9GAST|nr:hypothetical protein PoB_001918900 [Plakobranchus ocellatus]
MEKENIDLSTLGDIKTEQKSVLTLGLLLIVFLNTPANSNDEDLDKFYNDLDTAKTQCKSQGPLIVMGDFNAKVGTDKVDDIVGKHRLGIRNERGENGVRQIIS